MKAYKVESKLSYNGASWDKGAWILLTEAQRNELEEDYPGHLSLKNREPLTFIMPDAFNNSAGDLIAPGKLAYRFQYPFSYNGKIWEDESWIGLTAAEHAEITSIYPGYLKLTGKDPIDFGLPNPENQAVGGSGGGSMTASEIQTTLSNAGISTFTDAEKVDALADMTSAEIEAVLLANGIDLSLIGSGSSGANVIVSNGPTYSIPVGGIPVGEVIRIYAENGPVLIDSLDLLLINGASTITLAGSNPGELKNFVDLTRDTAGTALIAAGATSTSGPANVLPVSSFTYTANFLDLTFTSAATDSDGTITAWDWDFGGDGTSTLENPVYTFTTAGTFDVDLTVTDDQGGQHTSTQQIVVVAGVGGPALTVSTLEKQIRFYAITGLNDDDPVLGSDILEEVNNSTDFVPNGSITWDTSETAVDFAAGDFIKDVTDLATWGDICRQGSITYRQRSPNGSIFDTLMATKAAAPAQNGFQLYWASSDRHVFRVSDGTTNEDLTFAHTFNQSVYTTATYATDWDGTGCTVRQFIDGLLTETLTSTVPVFTGPITEDFVIHEGGSSGNQFGKYLCATKGILTNAEALNIHNFANAEL